MATPTQERFVRDFFSYTTGRQAVAPAATVVSNILIQADSAFEIIKLVGYADVAGAAETANTRVIPNALILITDTGSGRQLMSAAVPYGSLFGAGEMPFIWPRITSFEAANTNNIAITLVGNKIFDLQGA
jgi:hypothetical protein